MPTRRRQSKNIIGPHLAQARRDAGLGLGDLAARCTRGGWDCSENTISKIESGHRCVADAEAVALARALGVKLRVLFLDDRELF